MNYSSTILLFKTKKEKKKKKKKKKYRNRFIYAPIMCWFFYPCVLLCCIILMVCGYFSLVIFFVVVCSSHCLGQLLSIKCTRRNHDHPRCLIIIICHCFWTHIISSLLVFFFSSRFWHPYEKTAFNSSSTIKP